MTISSQIRVNRYNGNASQTTFPFTFKIFQPTDIVAIVTDTTTGIDTPLVYSSGYLVTMNSDQDGNPGGNILVAVAPSATQRLTITSAIDYLQPTELTNGGGFYPEVITDEFDRLTILTQQLNQQLDLTLRYPITDASSSPALPNEIARAGKLLGFDSSGNPVAITAGSGSYPAGVSTFNNRTGVVSLLAADVSNALGYTPLSPSAINGIVISAKNAPFNAVGDGMVDDTAALQAFFTYLSGSKGLRGYIPAGQYRITNQINITDTCFVYGDGWKDVRDITGYATRDWTQAQSYGTIIYGDFDQSVAGNMFYVTGNSFHCQHMEFCVRQTAIGGSTWAPANAPNAVYCFSGLYAEQGGMSAHFENIMLRNLVNGIVLYHVARGTFDGIFGQCFSNAIDITQNGDTIRINNVHIGWPFYTSNTAVLAYQTANANGITLGRVDNPQLSNIFMFGMRSGITTFIDQTVISGTPVGGKTSRMMVTNAGFDNMQIGMDLHDAVDISVSNMYVYNDTSQPVTIGIWSRSVLGGGQTPLRMMLTNVDLQGASNEAIRLEVPGQVLLTNVMIRDYNSSNGGFPGIAAYSGVTVSYSNLQNDTPSSTPLTEAFGTGVITGNGGGGGTGYAPLAGANFTGTVDNTHAYRSTGASTFTSGKGIELNYDTTFDGGFVVAYDHGAGAYKDINVGGNNINFKNNIGNVGSFDNNGNLLVGYSSSTGSYKLQVNGAAAFAGPITGVTATTGDNTTKLATTAFVTNAITGGAGSNFASAVRSTAAVYASSGVGAELVYDTTLNAGFVQAYDRGASAYANMNIGGLTVSFKSGTAGTNQGSFDANGYFLLGYSASTGAYKLQVNGPATFNGAVFGATATTGTNSTQLATTAFVASAISSGGGNPDFAATVRSTATTNPTTGTGVEVNYDTTLNAGFIIAYNRAASTYQNMNIGGLSLTFKSGSSGANQGSFDTNGYLLLGYSASTGAYKLQVNGAALISGSLSCSSTASFGGAVNGVTATAGDNTTKFATTAFVTAAISGATAGVSSFNTRTGAVTLTSADVTGALTYTPANLSGATFTGVVSGLTATAGDNTTKFATTAFVTAAVIAGVSGVSSFNTRTGAVTLTSSDVTTALTYTPANLAGATFTGTVSGPTATAGDNTTKLATTAFVTTAVAGAGAGPNFAAAVRSTSPVYASSGIGTELVYDTTLNAGFVQAYDRGGSVYKDMNVAGNTITFKSGTTVANQGSFDTNGYLLLGYSVSNGPYKIQVNGPSIFAGTINCFAGGSFAAAVNGITATAGDNTTKFATTAFVTAAIAAGTSGVSSFNTRTGAVTLTSSDVTTALTFTPANVAGTTFTGTVSGPTATAGDNTTKLATTAFVTTAVAGASGGPNFAAAVRSTSAVYAGSGVGAELAYDTTLNAGFVQAYDRGAGAYANMNVGGLTVSFKSGTAGTNQGSFDTNGYLLLGYSSSTGAYKLQVNGAMVISGSLTSSSTASFSGVVSGVTATAGDNTTKFATTAFVTAAISAAGTGGVSSFNTRTGAITLTSGDVTTALTYTPANLAGATFTGVVSGLTATAGDNTTKFATTAFVTAAVTAGTAGVSSFNTRTGAVTLTSSDVTTALTYTPANLTGATFTGVVSGLTATAGDNTTKFATTAFVTNAVGSPNFAAAVRSTAAVYAGSGIGTELVYDTTLNAGFVQAYDRGGAVYKDMNVAGSTITFKSGTTVANQGSFDANGYFLLGYSASTGAYKLQVNGAASISGALTCGSTASFSGAVTGTTATAGDNTTKFATTAFVTAAITASGAGVSSFNTRTGAVTLTSGDVTTALTFTPANVAGATFTGTVSGPTATAGDNTTKLATTAFVTTAVAGASGGPNFAAAVRSTSAVYAGSGIGTELVYDTGIGAGFVQAYDRGGAAYKDMNVAGSTISFKSGSAGTNQGSFDANGYFLLGYSASTGAYKLQVNGAATISGALTCASTASFGGAVTGVTATVGDNTTKFATTAFVTSAVTAAGVSSFNTRTGAVTLTSGDVTTALTYTPANVAGATFTGVVSGLTATAGDNTTKFATTAFVTAAITASGVSSFNTRTGAVTLTSGDVTTALTYTPANIAGATFTGTVSGPTATAGTNTTQLATTAFVTTAVAAGGGGPNFAAAVRSTSAVYAGSGIGTELVYDTSLAAGFVQAYDRGGSVYKDMNVAGSTITFKSGTTIANQGSFDANGYLLLGYSTSAGAYKIQVNGASIFAGAINCFSTANFGGAVSGVTATAGDNTTKFATTAFVTAAITASTHVSTFNTRSGAVTLTSGDVTTALAYTPSNVAGDNFTGAVNVASTIRSTGTTNPASGTGVEVNYDTGLNAGFIVAYNRTGSTYQSMNIGGSTLTFKSGAGVNAGSFDGNQSLLIGYSATNGSTYKLQVNSQIYATSTTIATSDKRVKEDIASLGEATPIIMGLRPVSYSFKQHPVHNFPAGKQIGFIAQEVEAVIGSRDWLGSVVSTNEDGAENLKGLAEAKIIPLLVKTIQELEARIRALEGKQ